MKSINWKYKVALASVIALSLGAGAYWHHERNKDVVAWVGGFSITQSEFLKEMHYRGGAFVHELDKQALLDEMIAKKLMLNKAYDMGYHESADVQRDYEHLLMGKVRKDFIEKKRESINISEIDVNKYYEQHRNDYKIPQKDRFAILFFKKRGKAAEKTTTKLTEILALAQAGKLPSNASEGFGEFSISHSEHQVSRYKGGEIGWFSKGEDVYWEKSVLTAGFGLKKPGDFSEIIETDKGYYLVRLMQRKEVEYRPLSSVADRIRHKLILGKQKTVKDDFEQQLKNNFSIAVNHEKLEGVKIDSQHAKGTKMTPPLGGIN